MWLTIILSWVLLFLPCYLLMCLRRKALELTYDRYDCDPTLIVSLLVPPIGIIFAVADLAAFSMGLREKGTYFNGTRCGQ